MLRAAFLPSHASWLAQSVGSIEGGAVDDSIGEDRPYEGVAFRSELPQYINNIVS